MGICRELLPSSRNGQQLESDGEGMASKWLAVDDSRPGPKITRQSPQIQPFIQFPRIAGNDPRAMGAHVFRDALLGGMTNVETA